MKKALPAAVAANLALQVELCIAVGARTPQAPQALPCSFPKASGYDKEGPADQALTGHIDPD
jgi:hypothetical protein